MSGFSSAAERLIFLDSCLHADRSGVMRITVEELSERCNVTRRTVHSVLEALMDRGLIDRERRGRYRVVLEALPRPAVAPRQAGTRTGNGYDRQPPVYRQEAQGVEEDWEEEEAVVRDLEGRVRSHHEADVEYRRLYAAKGPNEVLAYNETYWPILITEREFERANNPSARYLREMEDQD